jgi:predicted aconitase
MQLNDEESAIADGAQGEAARVALEQQIAVGNFFEAETFVPVSNVHIMGDYEVMGDAGYDHLRNLYELGGRVRIPTTRNAQPVEWEFAKRLRQSDTFVEHERPVRTILGKLGVSLVDTCINYQSIYTPRMNEHVAWGDTGTVAYANAVLGARTNYESGPAAIAAAITGRTPAYGFHLDSRGEPARAFASNRRSPTLRITEPLGHWRANACGAIGACRTSICHRHRPVPTISSIWVRVWRAWVRSRCITWAASRRRRRILPPLIAGGKSMPTSRYRAPISRRFTSVRRRAMPPATWWYSPRRNSLFELERIAMLFRGRRVHADSTVIITTNAMTRAAAHGTGALDALNETGALVLQGVCWYIMDPADMRKQFGWTRVCTNSAKLMNIIKAHGYEPILRRTADCVETAVSGWLP